MGKGQRDTVGIVWTVLGQPIEKMISRCTKYFLITISPEGHIQNVEGHIQNVETALISKATQNLHSGSQIWKSSEVILLSELCFLQQVGCAVSLRASCSACIAIGKARESNNFCLPMLTCGELCCWHPSIKVRSNEGWNLDTDRKIFS